MPRPDPDISASRLGGLDGLRGLAVLAVLLGNGVILLGPDPAAPDRATSHSPAATASVLDGPLVAAGVWGLTLLVVLSGFLLFRPFVAALVRGRDLPRTRDYYRNRVLRVTPAGVAVMAFLLLTGLVLGGAGSVLSGTGASPGLRAAVVFAWSLVLLLGCYLLLPLLVLLARALVRSRGGVWACGCVALVLLGIGIAARIGVLVAADRALPVPGAAQPWYTALGTTLTANADLFAMGMVAAVVVVAAREWFYSDEAIRRIRRTGAAMILLSPLGFVAWLEPVAIGPVFGLATTGLLLYLTLPGRRSLRRRALRFLEAAPLRLLGRISYSAWLWQVALLCLLGSRLGDAAGIGGVLVRVTAVTVAALVLALLTHTWVEAPVRRALGGPARQVRPVEGDPSLPGPDRLPVDRDGEVTRRCHRSGAPGGDAGHVCN